MSGVYMFFFTVSQLGGLCSFFIVVLGFLLRPVYDKWFQHEAVNQLHLVNKKELINLEAERNALLQKANGEERKDIDFYSKSK